MASIADIRRILADHGVAPLKKLGQNFLADENIINKIAEAAVPEGGNVLEIGPGMGALTCALAKRAKKVVAIEIDSGMVEVLKETLAPYDNVTVIHGDFLKQDVAALLKEQFDETPAVAGNLPYYITSKCIMSVLEAEVPFLSFTAMVQREVADRLAAEPGDSDYGALTAAVSYFGGADMLFTVSPNCFYPAPDVESAVVKICPGEKPDVPFAAYSKAVRTLFAMRRKTVLNNAKAGFALSGDAAKELLEQAGINPAARAETLGKEDFARLARLI